MKTNKLLFAAVPLIINAILIKFALPNKRLFCEDAESTFNIATNAFLYDHFFTRRLHSSETKSAEKHHLPLKARLHEKYKCINRQFKLRGAELV